MVQDCRFGGSWLKKNQMLFLVFGLNGHSVTWCCYSNITFDYIRRQMTITARKHNFTVVQSLSKAGVNLDFNQLYANFTFFKADLYASFTLKCKGM